MARIISSAEPEKLLRYSDLGLHLDSEIAAESARLAARLQEFEGRCTEPGCRVDVAHHAGTLSRLGREGEMLAEWVRNVARGFLLADSGTLWARLPVVPVRPPPGWRWPWPPIKIPWEPIFTIPVLPPWLRLIFARLPWLSGKPMEEIIRRLDDLLKPINWASKHAPKEFLEILKDVGRFLNQVTGHRGYVKRMTALGELLTGSAKAVDFLTDVIDLKESRRYFAGQLTNREIAIIAVKALIPIPVIDAMIANWLGTNVPDPSGHWKGLVPPAYSPELPTVRPQAPFENYKFTAMFPTYPDGTLHNGVDIQPDPFDRKKTYSVRPIGPGKVKKVGYNERGYGHYIVIEHTLADDTTVYSRYAHLKEKPKLTQGSLVSTETELGYMGDTGRTTGPHVHLEVYYKDAYTPRGGYIDRKPDEPCSGDPTKTLLEKMQEGYVNPKDVLDGRLGWQFRIPTSE